MGFGPFHMNIPPGAGDCGSTGCRINCTESAGLTATRAFLLLSSQ